LPVAPVLSDAVLQRMQAAVDAARSDAPIDEQGPDTEPIPRIVADKPTRQEKQASAVNGGHVKQARAAKPRRPAKRRGLATSVESVKNGHHDRPQTGAQATVAEPAKPDIQGQPSPEAVTDLPTRTVPTPATSVQPAATAARPVAPPELPKRAPRAPATRPATGAAEPDPVTPPGDLTALPEWSVRNESARPGPSRPIDTAAVRPPAITPPSAGRTPAVHAPPSRRSQSDRHSRRRRFGTARMVGAVMLVIAVGAAGVAFLVGGGPRKAPAHQLTPEQRLAAANRATAADWVMRQVSPGSTIACDKQMCAALAAARYPASHLHVLEPTSSPVGSTLVIETGAVRQQFGSNLDAEIAPVAITTIGSGPAGISIRMVAPNGAAAFMKQFSAAQHIRQENEAALPGGSLTTSPSAKTDLASGSVDFRLALAISDLAVGWPVYIVDFGNMATGASRGVPLRVADLSESGQAAHMTSKAYVAAIEGALHKAFAQYGLLWVKSIRLSTGVTVLRIDVGAPSPLGVTG
jgi:hypothetical protein